MTIEQSISGLTYSMFCALISLLIVGVSLILATASVFGFIKSLVYLLRKMKGGVDDLKESVKALSQTVAT